MHYSSFVHSLPEGRFSCFQVLAIMNTFKIFFLPLFVRVREAQNMSRGGAEREGGTESETGSRLWAVSTKPDGGLEPVNREIMTWAEVRSLTDWTTQAPRLWIHFYKHLWPGFLCGHNFSTLATTKKLNAGSCGKSMLNFERNRQTLVKTWFKKKNVISSTIICTSMFIISQ